MKNDDMKYVSLIAENSIINDLYIYVPSHFKISGSIKKNIESGGKVVITGSGIVEGTVKAQNLVLHGTFTGNAVIQNKISISGTAHISGSVSADKIEVEEGAVCDFEAEIGEGADVRYENAKSDSDLNLISTRKKDSLYNVEDQSGENLTTAAESLVR